MTAMPLPTSLLEGVELRRARLGGRARAGQRLRAGAADHRRRRPDAHRFYERLGFVASHEGFKLTF